LSYLIIATIQNCFRKAKFVVSYGGDAPAAEDLPLRDNMTSEEFNELVDMVADLPTTGDMTIGELLDVPSSTS